MGIKLVRNKGGLTEVRFKQNDKTYLDTNVRTKIDYFKRDGFSFASTLFRRRSNDKLDGNPLIHALKEHEEYTIKRKELIKFTNNAKKNLNLILSNHITFDLVIAIPSSSSIVTTLANRVSKITKTPLSKDIFRKKKNWEINRDIKNLLKTRRVSNVEIIKELRMFERRTSKKAMKNESFALKHVKHNTRQYFCTLSFDNTHNASSLNRVVLIEDTISSGSTINCAKKLLERYNPNIEVYVISFISGWHI